jgi:hypothetical protein
MGNIGSAGRDRNPRTGPSETARRAVRDEDAAAAPAVAA